MGYTTVMQDPDPGAAGGSGAGIGGGGQGGNSGSGGDGSGGDEDPEDVSGLKAALKAARDDRKQVEREMAGLKETLKGIDPAKYQQLLDAQKQHQQAREQWNQKEVQIRSEAEQEWKPQVQKAQAQADDFKAKYQELLLRTNVEAAYHAADGRVGGGEDGVTFFNSFFNNVRGQLKLNFEGETPTVEVVDATGTRLFSKEDASKPITPAEFFKQMHKHPVLGFFFEAPKASGGGYNNSRGKVKSGADTSKLSPEQKLQMFYEG